jgi:hypothetical protein
VNAYEASGFVREWAAATFLAGRAVKSGRSADLLAADLLAADVAQGVLVFRDYGEDLGSLVQPLLHGSAADAEQALIAYAVALARLHAGTIGCRDDHARIIRSALPTVTIPAPGHRWVEREPLAVAAMLGGSLPDDELAIMAGRLQSPGPWQALVHRDPCPDNVLLTADGTARLIDFEFAGPGHALLDAAYWRMGFPTCWCAGRVPSALSDRIDLAYRAALAEAVPLAAFERELAIVCVIWLFGGLSWLLEDALKADGEWGISTQRSRILHYLTTAIDISAKADVLGGTRRVASVWLDELRNRWPSSAPLALYPAFTRAAPA